MNPHHPLLDRLALIAADFAQQRLQRQARRGLDAADFARIAEAGYLGVAVPEDHGGYWHSASGSVRLIGEALRTLARGDAAVALVSAMHPAVLSYWLAAPQEAWQCKAFSEQLAGIIAGVQGGDWWGTITSEPGSGGDVGRTRATATRLEHSPGYRLSGNKHFGSGSGVLRWMVTTALPVNGGGGQESGEIEPDWFYLDTRGVPWDGSRGMQLTAEWDGHGMVATQSHAFRFDNFPATRIAWPGHLREIAARCGPLIGCLFTAVIVGIVEEAIATTAPRLRKADLRAYEQIEWERAQLEAWLIEQAYQGMLRAMETSDAPGRQVLQGKTAIAELSEACLARLCRIVGGGSFHRRSPLGHWAADVKALGFLRPPWGLAWQTLIDGSAESAASSTSEAGDVRD